MSHETVLQTFALNKDGIAVHVEDVDRGAACGCHCPSCGQSLIARQGDERAWHFAHAAGADCPGAFESALHLAAKAAIQGAHGIVLPPLRLQANYTVNQVRTFTGEAEREYGWVDFDQIQLEASLGAIRPDVLGYCRDDRWIVEVCVTHPVGPEKIDQIRALGVPAIEVRLDALERTNWTWKALEAVVVDSVENKTWLYCADTDQIRAEAEARARELAAPYECNAAPLTPVVRHRLFINDMIVDVIERPFGYCMWSSWHPDVSPMLSSIAKGLGGRWKPRFRNWLVPVALGPELLRQLRLLAERFTQSGHQSR